MLIIKKRRYKPLYKKFLNLKQNVQSRPRLLKFKKRKWKNLINFLKRTQNKRRGRFKLYDCQRYPLLTISFKNNFRYKLQTKQKINYFYGGLSKKYLKTIVSILLNKPKVTLPLRNSQNFFFEILERRLDIVLYRAYFVNSIRSARQLISHNHVFVNKKRVKNSGFLLKKGDLIEISTEVQWLTENNIKLANNWSMPPKYLQINYRTFQILFVRDIKSINLSLSFPFWLDLNTMLKYYER